jgi:Ca2+-binding RTX toxin-like protein
MQRPCLLLMAVGALLGAAVLFPASARAYPQPNDAFANAQAITGDQGYVDDANLKATKEVGEPDHAGNAGGASLWYTWTAPADGSVSFNAWDYGMDPLLAVYTGTSVDALTPVASNDDWRGLASRVVFDAVGGTEYRIAVDGYDGDTGYFELQWVIPPVNDNFADAIVITGRHGGVTGSNVGATDESGEPSNFGASASSVWYSWTPAANEKVRFDTRGSDFDTALAVYTGTQVDSLTLLSFNDDFISRQSEVGFTAVAGETYMIQVGGFGGGAGNLRLHWFHGVVLEGTNGNDVLRGTSGHDHLLGYGGNDVLYGRGGDDIIIGGRGADRLHGGRGADFLNSRDGRHGNDVIYGGRGHDTARRDSGDVIHSIP